MALSFTALAVAAVILTLLAAVVAVIVATVIQARPSGGPTVNDAAPCPKCSALVPLTKRTCPQCGAQVA